MTKFERLVEVAIKPWVLIGYLALVILSFLYLDRSIAYYFHELAGRVNLNFLGWLTQLGLGGLYLIPLFLIALFFRYISHNKEREIQAWFLWLSVLLPSLICVGLKITMGRARPELLFTDHLYGFYWLQKKSYYWSFPSGHSTTIMGFVFGLSALLPRFCYLYIIVGLILVSTRILLTQHFLSDVLIATYLALLEVGVLFWWFKRHKIFK